MPQSLFSRPLPAAGVPLPASERVDEWNLLRGLSFLAVVLQHSLGEYVYRSDIAYPDAVTIGLLYHLIRFGTLTFVFLAGALLFYRYGQVRRPYALVLFKRIGDIYVPFACWTLLYWIITRNLFGQTVFAAADRPALLREFIAPTAGYHLWFVVMIFQFYLMFPLFRAVSALIGRWTRAAKSSNGRAARMILLLSLLALAYGWLMELSYFRMAEWNVSGFWKTLLDYRTYEFPYYLFYFVLGGVCGLHLPRWRAWILKLLPWSTLGFIAMYLRMNHDLIQGSGESINLNISTYLKPTSFVLVTLQILMLYGWTLLLQKQGGPLNALLRLCGKYSFGAYLAHALIITLLALGTRSLPLQGWHMTFSVLTAAAAAPASLLLCAGLSRLPGGRWLTGGAARNARKSVPRR